MSTGAAPIGRRASAVTSPVAAAILASTLVAATLVAGAVAGASPAAGADVPGKEIVNSASGLRADVAWATTQPFAGVFLWPDNVSASQEFDLIYRDGGWFNIRARHSGQCLMLDWRGDDTANGARIIQYPYCSATYGQAQWRMRLVSGCYRAGDRCFPMTVQTLQNRGSGKCLDADNSAGGTPEAQAPLQQWDCITSVNAWNLGNQVWQIQ